MSRAWICLAVFGFLAPSPGVCVAGDQDKPPKTAKGKFTIGKETTYVTGPLDKDGYIDYVSALNEKLRGKITSSDNGAVLVWQALDPERTGMPPEFYKGLGMKKPEINEKFLMDSSFYLEKHLRIKPGKNLNDLYLDVDAAAEWPWKTNRYPIVAEWLKANEKPLALILMATKRPYFFTPLLLKSDKEPKRRYDWLTQEVQLYRELADFLATRAMWHLGEGRRDDAWQHVLACHRLGPLIARRGTLLDELVGIGVVSVAHNASIVFLDRAELDAKQVQACLRDLQALPPMPQFADQIDLTERLQSLDQIMMIDRKGFKYLEYLMGDWKEVQGIPKALVERFLDGIDWDPALRRLNRWWDRHVASLRVKDRTLREKQLDLIKAETAKLKKDFEGSLRTALVGKQPTAQARGELAGDGLVLLASDAFAAYRSVQKFVDRAEQARRNLHVAFALVAYQRDHKTYPKKLDELAPKYLMEVPLDFFSGKALIYRPFEKSFLLYSVGVNGQDEGGRRMDEDPPGDDIRIRLPLPVPKK